MNPARHQMISATAIDRIINEELGAALQHEGPAYPGISCVTPGNPYVLHCFPPFKTELTKQQHAEFDKIAQKIKSSFATSRPITKVRIIGHASTWHLTPASKLEERAIQRAGNAGEQLILRLHRLGIAKRVDVETDGESDARPWKGRAYSSTSGSQRAQNDRALNRRVEIHLLTAKRTKPKPPTCDRKALARKLLRLDREVRSGGAKTIRERRVLCLLRLLTAHLVDGDPIDDCFVDTWPPHQKHRCRRHVIATLCKRDPDEHGEAFRRAFFSLHDSILKPLEKTRLALFKVSADTPKVAILNTPECFFVRFFRKKARDKTSIYACFRDAIDDVFETLCDLP